VKNNGGNHPNYKEREFLESKGVLFLQDDYDWMVYNCYSLSIEGNGFGGTTVNAMVIDRYCEKYGLDFIEMLQYCRAM